MYIYKISFSVSPTTNDQQITAYKVLDETDTDFFCRDAKTDTEFSINKTTMEKISFKDTLTALEADGFCTKTRFPKFQAKLVTTILNTMYSWMRQAERVRDGIHTNLENTKADAAAMWVALMWLRDISFSREDCPEVWPSQDTRKMVEDALSGKAAIDLISEIKQLREMRDKLNGPQLKGLQRYTPYFDMGMVKDDFGDWMKATEITAILG